MTDIRRGDGLLMSCSLASRTAAMIDAAMTSVEANRSVMLFCSSNALSRSCSSRAIARLISPIIHPQSRIVGVWLPARGIACPGRHLRANTGVSLHRAGIRRLSKRPVGSGPEPEHSHSSLCRRSRMDGYRTWGRRTWEQYRRMYGEYFHSLSMYWQERG
jgi:hypothetical protein